MYTPPIYKEENKAEIEKFIRENGFGILVSNTDKLWATHIPLQLSKEGDKLYSHISKANPQWKNFSQSADVLAIFQGPHAYISSSWYDHENVPTWNYIAVHVYGKVRIIEGEQLRETLKHLVDQYEQHSAHPVSVDTMSSAYVEKEMRGIVGIEINITNIEATKKLSQNRDEKNYKNIISELEKRNFGDDRAVAEAMKNTSKNK